MIRGSINVATIVVRGEFVNPIPNTERRRLPLISHMAKVCIKVFSPQLWQTGRFNLCLTT